MLSSISLKEAQAAMLKLLMLVDRLCRENNLQYWLDHGTLLGAVRHQGFIPWDDDVDICILKKDYDQLLDLLEQESLINKDIFLFYRSNNASDQYWCEYLCSTKYAFGYSKKEIIPLRVDIFPMKSMPSSQEAKDRLITDTAKYFIDGKVNKPELLNEKYIKKNLHEALEEKQKFMAWYNNEYMLSCDEHASSSLVTYSYGDNISKNKEYFTYSDIFPLKKITFHDSVFFCPSNTDKYLSILYGTYMELPPKSERNSARSKFYYCKNKFVGSIYINEHINRENIFFFKREKLYWKLRLGFLVLRRRGIKAVAIAFRKELSSILPK